MLALRASLLGLIAFGIAAGAAIYWPALAQTGNADDLRKGHDLAVANCAGCHVTASDQATAPVRKPPAPSFASIAQRNDTNAETLRKFITTTHRGLDAPKGMPNPQLKDDQLQQVVAYILSLRQ